MDTLVLVSGKVLFCPRVEYEVAGKYFEFSFRSVLYVACKSKFNKACALFVFDGVFRSSAACEINADALETSDSIHRKKHQIFFSPIQSKWIQHFPFHESLLWYSNSVPLVNIRWVNILLKIDLIRLQVMSCILYSSRMQVQFPVSAIAMLDVNWKDCNMAWNKYDAASG
jgi:hypothetical protein